MSDTSPRLQLNRSLLTASEQGQLASEAVRLIQESLHARVVTMFLYSKRGLLVPAASEGLGPDGAEAEAYTPGDDLVGRCASGAVRSDRFGDVIVTHQPFTDTSPQFQRLFRSAIKPNTEIAYVPLNGPNRTFGVIRCIAGQTAEGQEIPFGPEDLGDLTVFAHQVAISLSSLVRKLELDILAHVNKLLTDRPEDVGRVYDLVTQALVEESTEYAACSIRIRHSGNLVLASLSAASGMNMFDKDRLDRRSDVGFSRDAFESREPVIIRDVQDRLHDFHDPNWLRENEFVTAAVFPIYFDDESIGVLALYLWYPYDFYATKVEFLKNLCHQVATATRVVRLLTARQQLIETMSAIVSHSGTADDFLQTVLDGACEVTGAGQGYICLVSRRDTRLHPRVTTANISSGDVPLIDVDGPGLTALAVRSQKSVRIGDVAKNVIYVDFVGDASGMIRSELVTPLVYERKVLGVIAVESDQVNYFSKSDELLLETLAQYATLIFQRDRLYDATKTLANVDFSRASQDLMTVIARSAAELVDADAAILRTYSSTLNELLFESHYPDSVNIVDVAPAMPRTTGACWDALTLKDVVLFENLPHNESFHNKAFATTNGYTEMVSVPLLLPGSDAEHPTELGVINLFFRTPSPYFDFERGLLRVLGVSASYAIHDLSLIEESNRTQALATITARATAAVELSSQLAHQALDPLRHARAAMESIERAVRRQDLVGIPSPLVKLQQHIGALESVVARLAPSERANLRTIDYTEVLSDAFRVIHTNLFAGSDRPHLHIGEGELWANVKAALARVLELLKLPVAAAFLSTQRDYSDMRRVAVTRNGAAVVDHIGLASFEEFASLTEQTHVVLPRKDGHFAWLDPQFVVGTPGAVLYGHQVTGGKVMIIALGLPEGRILAFEDLATLYETVAVQIFTYIDNAMFGIELDFLTSETGHLMGRAIGKIESGTRELLRVLTAGEDADREMLTLARGAIEDGINRLQLIHNNFYWFSVHRRMLDSASSATMSAVDSQHVDVQSMLEALMPMFSREAVERGLRPTRFFGAREKAIVVGPAGPLRLTLLNLFDNAVKFSYNDTHIDIRLRTKDDQCIISFENLGTGVAPDEFVTVFDRLRRSRYQDRSKRTEGLGLGLSYCRRVVVEIFHGQITLYSRPAMTPKQQRPYEGHNYLTTVTVKLPLAREGERFPDD